MTTQEKKLSSTYRFYSAIYFVPGTTIEAFQWMESTAELSTGTLSLFCSSDRKQAKSCKIHPNDNELCRRRLQDRSALGVLIHLFIVISGILESIKSRARAFVLDSQMRDGWLAGLQACVWSELRSKEAENLHSTSF